MKLIKQNKSKTDELHKTTQNIIKNSKKKEKIYFKMKNYSEKFNDDSFPSTQAPN